MNDIDLLLQKHHSKERDNLIPILQDIQDQFGYISEESIIKVGKYLNLSSSKIFGVATFYNQFRFEPLGKFHIRMCRGTSCHVHASAALLKELKKILRIEEDQTTKDGLFSIEIVPCLGACGNSPVVSVNDKYYSNVDIELLKRIIESYRQKED